MNFLDPLKKYFWLVHLIFIAVAAYFSANIVSSIFQRKLDSTPEVNLADLNTAVESSTRSRTFYQPVMDRNLFDSSAVPLDDEEMDDGIDQTTLNLKLLGTIAGGKDDGLAIILDNSSRQSEVYRIGEKVSGAKVKRIERGAVILERGGKEEKLTLPDITAVATSSPKRRSTGKGNYKEGISHKGGGAYDVDSKVIDDALGNMGDLMKQARIVPHMKQGQIDGFKVYNIKSKSLFKTIGLKNGDIIHNVNGMEVSSPEQGLRVFEALRNERNIVIDLTRRGSKKTLSYTIR